MDGVTVYSCYCSPNIDINQYELYVARLGADVAKHRKRVFVCGDFNRNATEWGSPVENARGRILMDWVSGDDLVGWVTTEGRLGKFGRLLANRVGEMLGCASDYDEYIGLVVRCCNAMFPRRLPNRFGNRRATYWWCEDVMLRRRECIRCRRRVTRTNRPGTRHEKEEALAVYRGRRKAYTRAIMKAKKAVWSKLIEDLNRDEWGQSYRLLVKKAHLCRNHKISDSKQWEIATSLFPVVDDDVGADVAAEARDFRGFSEEELVVAADRMKSGRALGPDGIGPDIVKAALREQR